MKNKLIIVGLAINATLLKAAQMKHPDAEVIVVDNEEEMKKYMKALEPEPISYVARQELPIMPTVKACDMKFHNPYPEPHRSSKRSRKY